ncbi:unnamed protein product [Polarella glacialis]|uniref:Uncharacterized protein n=1 Tax=Polarella glacialis TaxID=89957 RepID=A0A813HE15_POLGL|nr:unnamed protein product [Polarella glacialis]
MRALSILACPQWEPRTDRAFSKSVYTLTGITAIPRTATPHVWRYSYRDHPSCCCRRCCCCFVVAVIVVVVAVDCDCLLLFNVEFSAPFVSRSVGPDKLRTSHPQCSTAVFVLQLRDDVMTLAEWIT